jgi:ABC-type bacteriocin/lantibiotic exporter with double-glycine peptidase domain
MFRIMGTCTNTMSVLRGHLTQGIFFSTVCLRGRFNKWIKRLPYFFRNWRLLTKSKNRANWKNWV